MFDEWLKFWRQWMFWWLPGGDEPEKDKPPRGQNQQTTRTASGPKAGDALPTETARPARGEPAMAKPDAEDLTVIRGIGPAIAHKLDALGVRTFADLAAADPHDLADKIASRPVTATRVREWIAEAKKRAATG